MRQSDHRKRRAVLAEQHAQTRTGVAPFRPLHLAGGQVSHLFGDQARDRPTDQRAGPVSEPLMQKLVRVDDVAAGIAREHAAVHSVDRSRQLAATQLDGHRPRFYSPRLPQSCRNFAYLRNTE